MMSSRTRLFAFSAPFSSVLGFCLHSSKMAAISCIMSTIQVQNDKNIAVEFLSRMPGRAAAILLPSQKSHMLKTMEEEEKMRWDICIILLLEKVFEKWYERWPLQGKKKGILFLYENARTKNIWQWLFGSQEIRTSNYFVDDTNRAKKSLWI